MDRFFFYLSYSAWILKMHLYRKNQCNSYKALGFKTKKGLTDDLFLAQKYQKTAHDYFHGNDYLF